MLQDKEEKAWGLKVNELHLTGVAYLARFFWFFQLREGLLKYARYIYLGGPLYVWASAFVFVWNLAGLMDCSLLSFKGNLDTHS